jgi:hypothetical protein
MAKVQGPHPRVSHLLGAYNLSFSATVVSPEHVSHSDVRLTQNHERIHRNLTFSSTFGFLSFVVAQIARSHPDPIHRYRFREIRDLLIEHSLDPQEGCAYFSEYRDALLLSTSDAAAEVLNAASKREAWAVRWMDRATRPLRLGNSMQQGFAYLLADLSLSTPIIQEIAYFLPDIDRFRSYLDRPANNPNSRFLAFARAAFWRRWSLRKSFRETLDAFCKEESVPMEALNAQSVSLDRLKIARLEYLMDVSFQRWLSARLPDYRIVPIEKRMTAAQTLLDQWRPLLPLEAQGYLPNRADFLQSLSFFDRNDAAPVNPEGHERVYRSVENFASFFPEVEDKELCVCLLSPNAYPLVEVQLFEDSNIPDGFLVVTVSLFDPTLPNSFEEIGYSFWGDRRTVLKQLSDCKARRMVLIVQIEDIDEQGARILGELRCSFTCSIRVLRTGLVLSESSSYLRSLGSEQFPVRAYVIMSGRDQQIPILVAKTDKVPKLEFIAPITLTTLHGMQALQYDSWVHPKRDIDAYEQDQGQVRATVNACERIARFGFG